jgi:hypothetical protein
LIFKITLVQSLAGLPSVSLWEETLPKQKSQNIYKSELLTCFGIFVCGESRIRTCEDVISGFTVRPRWPLEYLPLRERGCKYKIVFKETKPF